MVEAQPQPTSQSPSRMLRGSGLRDFQPKASAPASKQRINPRLVKGRPLIGSFAMSLRRRSSIGSSFSAWASSSIADSSPNI